MRVARRAVSIVMSIVLVFGLAPAAALADQGGAVDANGGTHPAVRMQLSVDGGEGLSAQSVSYSEWGEWSAWQDGAVSASDTRQVDTRIVTTYDVRSDTCGDSSGTRCYLKQWTSGSGYTLRFTHQYTDVSSDTINSAGTIGEGGWYSYASNVAGRIVGPGTAYYGAFSDWCPVFIYATHQKTQYRYRTRDALSGASKKTVPAGDYVIQSKTGGYALDVEGASADNGANVRIWTRSGLAAQVFTIESGSISGSSIIKNKATGKVLDTSGNVCGSANVRQWGAVSGNKGQSWVFEDAGGGYVYIRNAWGYYLDVYNGTAADGANVQAWAFSGSDAQKWKLIANTPITVDPGEDAKAAQEAFDSGTLVAPKKKVYTGKAIKPAVTLVVNGTKLTQGTHYKLSYKNNKKVGTATIVIIGIGKYAGAKLTCTFRIVPKKTALRSAEALLYGKKMKVTWSASGNASCTGYQIRYSTDKSMKGAKTRTVKGRAKTSCTISGLAEGKTYYIQIRVYIKIKGVLYCSSWSTRKRVKVPQCGAMSGIVSSASTGQTLPGAKIIVCTTGGKRVCSVKANSAGRYRLPALAKGTYSIKVRYKGYIVLVFIITIEAGKTTHCENALLVKSYSGNGTATGTICSATTGRPIAGAKLVFRKGWNNTTGDVVGTCWSSSTGGYSASLPAGYYTVVITCDGYIVTFINVVIGKGTISGQNGVVNPIGKNVSNYRAVLTWGYLPYDLDSHLVSTGTGGSYHVCFGSKNGFVSGAQKANLDVDDTSSYGPETVTFKVAKNRSYVYFVEQYSRDGKLPTSSAKVRLYKGNKLIRTYTVRSTGDGRFWNVFKIVNGKVSDVETITYRASDVASETGLEGKSPYL